MKILTIVGSSKKDGKTAMAVKEELEQYMDDKNEINLFFANELNVNYCTGCGYCRQVEACSQKDDMEILLHKLHDADLVVIGSPIYYGGLSAQLKVICDRLHPAYRGKGISTLKNTKLILVFTQDSSKDAYEDFRKVNEKYLFSFMGFNLLKTIVVGKDGKKVY